MNSRLLRTVPWHVVVLVVVAVAVSLLGFFVLDSTAPARQLERQAYDGEFRLRGPRLASTDVVLVTMDEASLLALGARAYPIPRRWMADAVTHLHQDGARAIGVSFGYFARSIYGSADDRALSVALQHAGNVVIDDEAVSVGIGPPSASQPESIVYPVYRGRGIRLGLVNVPADEDGVIRSLDPMVGVPGSQDRVKRLPAFPAVLASLALHQPVNRVVRSLPDHLLINYTGYNDPTDRQQHSFVSYSFSDVALGHVPAAAFRGRVVLVIPYAILNGDIYSTPLGTMYGGVLEANALETILRGNPIRPLGGGSGFIASLALALVGAAVGGWSRPWRSIGGLVAVGLGVAVASVILFQRDLLWVRVIGLEIALFSAGLIVLALGAGFRVWTARRKTRVITILFVDVRGYAAMAENLPPARVAAALDIYLGQLSRVARRHGGTIIKYVGDQMVVLWNAPEPQPDHVMSGVTTAVEMVRAMRDVNDRLRARGLLTIRYGIGLNTGEAIVGRLGPYSRQFDVLGDTVNTAARLCEAASGGEVLIGEATRGVVADRLEDEETDPLMLKGKSRMIRTYRVLALSEAVQGVRVEAPAT